MEQRLLNGLGRSYEIVVTDKDNNLNIINAISGV